MRLLLLSIGLIVIASSSSCRSVKFYERALLADPIMNFDQNRAELHFHQKTFYSQEGSAGGIGTTAGGGCGCY